MREPANHRCATDGSKSDDKDVLALTSVMTYHLIDRTNSVGVNEKTVASPCSIFEVIPTLISG